MKLRRNDVVLHTGMYGRVWRRIDEHHVQVIDCGKMVRIYHEDDPELVLSNDYKGCKEWGKERFIRMTSLRRLKIMAKQYQPHFGGVNAFGQKHTKEERKAALANRKVFVSKE